MINNAIWAVGFGVIVLAICDIGYVTTYTVIHHFAPPSLTSADKAPAPLTKHADDIDSFVTYDVAPKDRAAALLGAQRAVTWMENHGVFDYYPPAEGASP